MTRILITGGTGDLGSKIAVRLNPHMVRIMSRSERPTHFDSRQEWAKADLSTGEGIVEAVRDVEVIVHAASNPFNMAESDVQGTKRLIEAARAANVRHLLYISIIGMEQIPFFYYYYTAKLQVEQIVKASGIPFTISRAAQFHSFVDRILRGIDRFPLVLPFPTAMQFQTIDTGEYADYLMPYIAAPAAGCIPDVAGPHIMQAGEMARLWLKAQGKRKLIVKLPARGGLPGGFRKGYNTAPQRAFGKMTWEMWLSKTYQDKE